MNKAEEILKRLARISTDLIVLSKSVINDVTEANAATNVKEYQILASAVQANAVRYQQLTERLAKLQLDSNNVSEEYRNELKKWQEKLDKSQGDVTEELRLLTQQVEKAAQIKDELKKYEATITERINALTLHYTAINTELNNMNSAVARVLVQVTEKVVGMEGAAKRYQEANAATQTTFAKYR